MALSREAKDSASVGELASKTLVDICCLNSSFVYITKAHVCGRSSERPTGDLRERMKNKRQDVDPENLKPDLDEPTSPTTRVRPLFAVCFLNYPNFLQ